MRRGKQILGKQIGPNFLRSTSWVRAKGFSTLGCLSFAKPDPMLRLSICCEFFKWNDPTHVNDRYLRTFHIPKILYYTPPPPRGRGAYLFQAHLRGGDLFNLETTMVSVLHKGLEYIVEKLRDKKF